MPRRSFLTVSRIAFVFALYSIAIGAEVAYGQPSEPNEHLVVVAKGNDVAAVADEVAKLTGGTTSVVWPTAGIVKVTFDPAVDADDQADAMAEVAALTEVASVQPNYRYAVSSRSSAPRRSVAGDPLATPRSRTAAPSDPRIAEQWYLKTISAFGGWDIQRDSPSIVVAVIDQGVHYGHVELAQRTWSNDDEIPGNGRDDDGNGFVDDVRGWDFVDGDENPAPEWDPLRLAWEPYGTHVAGTIGAEANNDAGITGISWDVRIMPVRVFDGSGGSSADVVAGVRYALENGANVINASLSGAFVDAALQAAVSEADAAGALFVCEAGNGFQNIDTFYYSPASFNLPNQITVAATGKDDPDFIIGTSNFGVTKVHLAAPGEGILSCIPGSDMTGYQNAYAVYDGTSTAAPIVAGAAALVWARNPEMTHHQVRQRLLESVDVLDRLDGLCATSGRLNLLESLDDDPPEPPSEPQRHVVQRSWGAYANQSAIIAYYQSLYALYEPARDATAGTTANQYAYYALYLSYLAGSQYSWTDGESAEQAKGDYLTLRYYQYGASFYAAGAGYNHLYQTGGGYSYNAVLWSLYAFNYATFDLYE